MPTYEYLCPACSHRFETWQKMIDDPLEICPACGGHIRRVYYPAGIVFKGSGFYKTDHRASSSNVESNGHSSGKENTGTDTAATTSETKASGENKPTSTETSSKSSPPSEHKVAAG